MHTLHHITVRVRYDGVLCKWRVYITKVVSISLQQSAMATKGK